MKHFVAAAYNHILSRVTNNLLPKLNARKLCPTYAISLATNSNIFFETCAIPILYASITAHSYIQTQSSSWSDL